MTNKQPIPWKRVFVEAAAIVAGILLAFAIDAGWDERNEREEEKEILQSLVVEFEANRDEADSVLRVHENALQHAATLVNVADR